MEINTIIYCLNCVQVLGCLDCPHSIDLDGSIPSCRATRIKEAKEIVEKYQKIKQIYSDYLKCMNPDNLADRLGEVIEDGNDD